MTEDELRPFPNELEGLLINTSNCVLIGTERTNLKKCDIYIDKIRQFFVSTLERRIYALLEKFVYGEDADRFHEQFPCLKKCIDTATTSSGPANESCAKYIGTEIVQGAIKGTIKYLIKEGFFTAFINSVVLNNRINKICREMDALGIEKIFLGYLNVWNFLFERDYCTVNPFELPTDGPLSDLVLEVGTEDQECLSSKNLKRRTCHGTNNENDSDMETSSVYQIRPANSNPEISKSSVSNSHKKLGTRNLRLSISKVQFAACGCVDVARQTKFRKLRLPCKSEALIKKIFKVDKNLPHSCLTSIRKKFEEGVQNISSCLNDVLSRTDSRSIKNLYLVCEIRPNYVSFKLKSIQGLSSESKPCLFSARVVTCRSVFKNQMSFRKSLTKGDRKNVQGNEISDQNFGESNCPEISRLSSESHLSDVEEKEEEIYEIDGTEFRNVSDPEVLRRETNLKMTVQVRNENDFETPKPICSCGQVSVSRSSFFKIEMKPRDVSKCFEKPSLKEGVPVLKMKYKVKTDCQSIELSNLKEIGEQNFKKADVICTDLQEFEQSRTIFSDSKETDASACSCQDLLENKASDSKIVPESQKLSESIKALKNIKKSQIPIAISRNMKLFQSANTGESKADLASSQLDPNIGLDKKPIPKLCGTNCPKIPVLVKENFPVGSACRESPSFLLCKNRLKPNENLETSSSRKRVSSTQRCSKFSRINLLKKSDHLVETDNPRTSYNLTFIKSINPSVETLPKTPKNVPKPIKRNFFRLPYPPPRSRSPPARQINIGFPIVREFVRSKAFVTDKPKTSQIDVYQRNPEKVPQTTYIIVTHSEEGIDQCDSKCLFRVSLDRVIQNLETSKDTNHLKSKIREIVRPEGIKKRNISSFRTVSVQTVEQNMVSKGINIDIRETREILSKTANVNRRKTSTKGVNTDLIPKASFISLQTNVTKIISVADITIFEGGFEKRFKKNLKKKSYLCCSKREKNSKFHLKSDYPMNSDFLSAEICKGIPKIKVNSCDSRHNMGIDDSWAIPNKSKALSVINAICDPFSNKSIKRIKYLIRTKLCRMWLDRDTNEGSKTFISSERYYVSVSSEKTCHSSGRRIFSGSSKSSKSGNSDVCCRKERMSGGSDNLFHEYPIRIGSDWEFDGGDDCFLIRKRRKISKGRNVKTSKRRELRTSKEKEPRTSKKNIRTSSGKDEQRFKKNYSDFEGWGENKSCRRDEDRNKTKEKKISPGDVITSYHLGRRHEKALRNRGLNTYIHNESDKENGGKDYKRNSQLRSNFGRERGQLLTKNMSRVKGKNRLCSGKGRIDESFCDLEQNVRAKLSEYVNLCKSAKHFLIKDSDDVYGVSSTYIPFSDRSELRRT